MKLSGMWFRFAKSSPIILDQTDPAIAIGAITWVELSKAPVAALKWHLPAMPRLSENCLSQKRRDVGLKKKRRDCLR